MTGLWEIAFVIFLLSLTVLVYLLIPTISELRRTLKRLNKALAILNDDLPGILKNVNEITETVNVASKKIDSTVQDVLELEHLLSKEIKQPLQNIAQTIATVLQLFNKVFHRKSSKK